MSEVKQVLKLGLYKAILIEYGGGTWNGKYSFKVIIDADYGGDHPLRLWHFCRANYLPNISIANIAGWLAGDEWLQRLTPEVLLTSPQCGKSLNKTWCCVNLGISKYSGKNDILGLYPPIDIKPLEIVNTPAPVDDVPFDFEKKQETLPSQEPLGFEPGSDDCPF